MYAMLLVAAKQVEAESGEGRKSSAAFAKLTQAIIMSSYDDCNLLQTL